MSWLNFIVHCLEEKTQVAIYFPVMPEQKSLNHDVRVSDLILMLIEDFCCFKGCLMPLSEATAGVEFTYIQIRSETALES